MTELLQTTLTMPSASMGRDNPLPDLIHSADVHAAIDIDTQTVSEAESRYMGWGKVNGILPYTLRDGYDRQKKPRTWQAVVLRNAFLEATFLPELGGRLWSLRDLKRDRNLLHRNPVFQPCNLALRNAWISGGVEWNCGIIGHTPLTVDPMFTELLALQDGTPVLRMYQYERVRGLVYRVEAVLPDGSPHLLVRVRIDNARDADTAVYWWSNMAVDEREGTRVLVPANRAFQFEYGLPLSKIPVPLHAGRDASCTTTIHRAIDFFFDIPDGQRRWIAALDEDGCGLCQTSTDVLCGRKLFLWGMNNGGRHWQSFLAEPGCAYLEIQAGLGRTQLEHLPMPAGASHQWTEAYGALQLDPVIAHGEDWDAATQAADRALEQSLPRAALEDWNRRLAAQLDGRTGTLIRLGDGWGALEQRMHGEAFRAGGLRFPARSMHRAEREWLALLEQGALPCPDPLREPAGYQVHEDWTRLLEASIRGGRGDHWYAQYQLGVMKTYQGDMKSAAAAFAQSLRHAVSPWALRCQAILLTLEGKPGGAADKMLEAVALKPQRHLMLETVRALLSARRYADAEQLAKRAPASIRGLGRMRAMRVEALLALGDAKAAERLLRGNLVVDDMREGEVMLSDLWERLCELKGVEPDLEPMPHHLDFRMK